MPAAKRRGELFINLILTAILGGVLPIFFLLHVGGRLGSSLQIVPILLFGTISLAGFYFILMAIKFFPRVYLKVLAFVGWTILLSMAGLWEIFHFIPEQVRFIAGGQDSAEFAHTDFSQVSGLRVEIGKETRQCIGLYPNSSIKAGLQVTPGSFFTYGAAMIRAANDPQTYLLEVLFRDNQGQAQKLEELEFKEERPLWRSRILDFSSLSGRKGAIIFQVRSLGEPFKPGAKTSLILVSNPRLIPAGLRRPNIILIVADSLRADHVSYDPRAPGLTPRLAGLANRGVSFARHYSQSSWTTPSTASLLTGTMPIQTGAISFKNISLESRNETAAEILSRAGWRTAAFSTNALVNPDLGFDQGFDSFEMVTPYPGNCWREGEKLTAKAKTWIRANPRLPFFLFLDYMDTHYPYFPPLEYIPFRGKERIPLTDFFKVLIWGGPFNIIRTPRLDLVTSYHTLYRGETRYLDDCLGGLFEELEREGLLRNTIIIFTSDHGEEFCDHGLMYHGTSLFEELIHVPLIIYDGRREQPGGKVIHATTSNLDLLPTLLDALDLPIPPALLGRSIRPLFQGEASPPGETVFAEMPEMPHYDQFHGSFRKGLKESYLRAMIKGQIKIITATDSQTKGVKVEIYDLAHDPLEKNSLARIRSSEFDLYLGELNSFFKDFPAIPSHAGNRQYSPEAFRHLKTLGYIQ